jgi:hypothetical protein
MSLKFRVADRSPQALPRRRFQPENVVQAIHLTWNCCRAAQQRVLSLPNIHGRGQ